MNFLVQNKEYQLIFYKKDINVIFRLQYVLFSLSVKPPSPTDDFSQRDNEEIR